MEGNIYLHSYKSNRFMSNLQLVESLMWNESPAVRRLLEVIALIIANEYIATAKRNPEIFK